MTETEDRLRSWNMDVMTYITEFPETTQVAADEVVKLASKFIKHLKRHDLVGVVTDRLPSTVKGEQLEICAASYLDGEFDRLSISFKAGRRKRLVCSVIPDSPVSISGHDDIQIALESLRKGMILDALADA